MTTPAMTRRAVEAAAPARPVSVIDATASPAPTLSTRGCPRTLGSAPAPVGAARHPSTAPTGFHRESP